MRGTDAALRRFFPRPPNCATTPEAPRLTPMMRKMPATPAAAAISPAMNGITNWPMRLPIMPTDTQNLESARRERDVLGADAEEPAHANNVGKHLAVTIEQYVVDVTDLDVVVVDHVDAREI